jgi:flagellar basal-body rod protein FlgB
MGGITLEDKATRALITALDGLAARQRVISNNLANVDTPGFKASDVSFARQLGKALATNKGVQMVTTHPQHLTEPSPSDPVQVITRSDTSHRLDGNNVDIDKEMTYLAETVLHFQAAAQVVSRRLSLLRTVINEGRR